MSRDASARVEPLDWSQEILRELFANTQTGVLLLDLHGSIVEVNGALCRLLDQKREAIVGEPLLRFVSAEDRDATSALVAELRSGTRNSYKAARSVLTASGERVSTRVSASVVRARTGEFICALEFVHDLRPQLAAERRLRENEARYRSIVEHQTEMVLRWRGEGIRTFVNDAYCRHWQQPREALVGTSFFPQLGEGDLAFLRAHLAGLTPESPSFAHRFHVAGQDQLTRWLEWTSRGVFDAGGALVEIQSVGRDITERVQMNEALRSSENRYRRLFDDLPIAAWGSDWTDAILMIRQRQFDTIEELVRMVRADPAWIAAAFDLIRPLGANQAALRLFGVHRTEQLMGAVLRLAGADLAEAIPRALELVAPIAVDGQRTVVREVSGIGIDGQPRDVLIRWTLVSRKPEWRVIVTALDQTESRKLARQLDRHRRLLADAESVSGLGSWEWQASDGKVRGSAELWRILEGAPSDRSSCDVEELPGWVHPDDASLVAHAAAALVLGDMTAEAEFRIVGAGGRTRIVHGRGFSTRDASGTVIAARGILRDVTEETRAAESAERQRQELIRADRMISLGVLVSGVAHEINNPSHFILLNTPLLRNAWRDLEPILEEAAAENGSALELGGLPWNEVRVEVPGLISDILDAATRTGAMVSDLRDFARDSGPEAESSIAVNDVVRAALRLAGRRVERTTDHFELDLAEALPPIRGSLQRMAQVVVNLILTACEATESRGCAIALTTALDPSSRSVTIRVTDQGRGLPEEPLRRLEEPDSAPASPGLGRELSKRIVEEHGGRLTFERVAGGGTTATIAIPIDGGS